MVVRDDGLPDRVTVYEVGPRDGLQNEKTVIPLEVKVELVHRLVAAGLPIVEVTSFVRPEWGPQLAGAERLLGLVARGGAPARRVLAPNERGGARALERGGQHIAFLGGATETSARRNLNRSLDEQFSM